MLYTGEKMADDENVFFGWGGKNWLFIGIFWESDSDNEFEGFEPDGILNDVEIITEIALEQSASDQECPEDVEVGRSREDSTPLVAPFTGNPGLQSNIPDNPEAIDFFNILFEDEMWEILVTETNRYAQNKIHASEGNLKQFSRLKKWEPITQRIK